MPTPCDLTSLKLTFVPVTRSSAELALTSDGVYRCIRPLGGGRVVNGPLVDVAVVLLP